MTEPVQTRIDLAEVQPHVNFHELGEFAGRPVELLSRVEAIYPYYDFEHASSTQRMCAVLLGYEETKVGEVHKELVDRKIDTLHNQRALWLAAYFHDIGRESHWYEHHHDDAKRSEQIFLAVMQSHPELLEEAGGLLVADAARAIRMRKTPDDVLSKVLHDGDLMDAVRVEPNTRQGFAYLQKEWGVDGSKFLTDFCKQKNHRETAMRFAGWDF